MTVRIEEINLCLLVSKSRVDILSVVAPLAAAISAVPGT